MKPIEIHLSDYKKPEFEFERVYLYFKLDPEKTIVNSTYNRIRLNEYKRRQAAPGLRVSAKAFGMGRRFPIVNHFKS